MLRVVCFEGLEAAIPPPSYTMSTERLPGCRSSDRVQAIHLLICNISRLCAGVCFALQVVW